MTPPPHIPDEWHGVAEAALARRAPRIVVLGATDTGKTTFCTWLLDCLRGAGLPALGLDADPGQPWVGPPACVGLGLPGEPACHLAFIGETDPMRGFRALLDGCARLSARAGSAPLVVNTAGLVSGPGLRLQPRTARVLRADLVVVIERGDEASPLVDALGRPDALRLRASPAARRKSPAARRRARRVAFAEAFRDAAELPVPFILPEEERTLCAALGAGGGALALALALGDGRLLTAAPGGAIRGIAEGGIRLDAEWHQERRGLGPPRRAG